MSLLRLGIDPESLARAAEIVVRGGLVAFPTETVYGLGARADRGDAVRAIFAAKGRPATNPLIVHVSSIEQARALADPWPDAAERLAKAFWPGPLTLVVPALASATATEARAGGATIGLRVPDHATARAFLEAVALPIAAPSANPSTSISPTSADHVAKGLGDRVDALIDGGASSYGIESTIVDITRDPCVLLRHGAIPLAAIEAVLPVVDGAARVVPEGERAEAPGGQARHYAPTGRLLLVASSDVARVAASLSTQGARVGVIQRAGESLAADSVAVGPAGEGALILPEDAVGFARGLYAALHKLEDRRCDAIVLAAPPDGDAWAAVRDRLRRASFGNG